MLSDWTFENPGRVFAKLKKEADYFNFQRRTVGDFFRDVRRHGLGATVRDRLEWGRMRMDPTDLADVTGATYTFLANGRAPGDPWTALFEPGERVLLRFINAGADTIFDVRIPGLTMKVVEVSGQWVAPVDVEEIRIANAETYVVLVEPRDERAYAIYAEASDRSGFALAALAPRDGMRPPVPARRPSEGIGNRPARSPRPRCTGRTRTAPGTPRFRWRRGAGSPSRAPGSAETAGASSRTP